MNFADTAQKEVEITTFDGNSPTSDTTFRNENKPGSYRLVRTAAKAFGEGSNGDEKSGCQGNFKTFASGFLTQNDLSLYPSVHTGVQGSMSFFANAAAMFFLHEQMISFLECCGAEINSLRLSSLI